VAVLTFRHHLRARNASASTESDLNISSIDVNGSIITEDLRRPNSSTPSLSNASMSNWKVFLKRFSIVPRTGRLLLPTFYRLAFTGDGKQTHDIVAYFELLGVA